MSNDDQKNAAPRARSVAEVAAAADVHVSEALEFVRLLGIAAATPAVLLDHEMAQKVEFELGLRTLARGMAAIGELRPTEPIETVLKRHQADVQRRFGLGLTVSCDNAGRGFYFRLDLAPSVDSRTDLTDLDGYPVAVTVASSEAAEPPEDGPMTVRQIAARIGLPDAEVLSFLRKMMGHKDAELDSPLLNTGTATVALYQLDLRRRATQRIQLGDLAPTEPIETVREQYNAWALANHGGQLYYGYDDERRPFFFYLKLNATEAPADLPTDLGGYPLVPGLVEEVLSTLPEPGRPRMPRQAVDRPPPGADD